MAAVLKPRGPGPCLEKSARLQSCSDSSGLSPCLLSHFFCLFSRCLLLFFPRRSPGTLWESAASGAATANSLSVLLRSHLQLGRFIPSFAAGGSEVWREGLLAANTHVAERHRWQTIPPGSSSPGRSTCTRRRHTSHIPRRAASCPGEFTAASWAVLITSHSHPSFRLDGDGLGVCVNPLSVAKRQLMI